MKNRDESDRRKLTYRDAGVDIDAKEEALRRITAMVHRTRTPGVLADLGSFGGLFAPDLSEIAEPVLCASADGVGTKLKIAFMTGIHDSVGEDLVNHCVNDILVQGARPLFFMDYIATGRLEPGVLASLIEGVARGCREAGCALLGGETAEMPGFYGDDEYDVAGFIVGLVDKGRVLDGSRITPGDIVIGLPSTGLHTNGYSLARKLFFDTAGLSIDSRVNELDATVGEELLRVHRSYLRCLERPLRENWVEGLAHITGGGIPGNLPRILPKGTAARIVRGSWPVPPVFTWLQREGGVDQEEMDRAFNMGIGMIAVVDPENAGNLEAHLDTENEKWHRIGSIESGDGDVRYE